MTIKKNDMFGNAGRQKVRKIEAYKSLLASLAAVVAILVSCTAGAQEKVSIPFNGDYGYTSDETWPRKVGWSKNFMNGAPEENGVVQRDGFLTAEIFWPTKERKAIPFFIWMHGCSGYHKEPKAMMQRYAELLAPIGVGVLAVDSLTNRNIKEVCGYNPQRMQAFPTEYWSQRRAQDAYSALEFLVDKGFADPSRVYLGGLSNGGAAVFTSMERTMKQFHKYTFAMGFAQVAPCSSHVSATFYAPIHVFVAGWDEKNNVSYCTKMRQYNRRGTPFLTMHWYDKAYHGYENEKGYRYEGIYRNTDPVAAADTRETIKSAILKDLAR